VRLRRQFVIFNVLYIEWAVRRYPHNNSMAGLAAFIYGIPVGLGCGILAGLVIGVALRGRSLPGDLPAK
jgi:hypothetical protein